MSVASCCKMAERPNQNHATRTNATATTPAAAHVTAEKRLLSAKVPGLSDARGEPESDSSLSSSSATFTSAMLCERRLGSFRRQRVMIFSRSRGSARTISRAGFGSCFRTAARMDILESP